MEIGAEYPGCELSILRNLYCFSNWFLLGEEVKNVHLFQYLHNATADMPTIDRLHRSTPTQLYRSWTCDIHGDIHHRRPRITDREEHSVNLFGQSFRITQSDVHQCSSRILLGIQLVVCTHDIIVVELACDRPDFIYDFL
jgi:hypothetical protein